MTIPGAPMSGSTALKPNQLGHDDRTTLLYDAAGQRVAVRDANGKQTTTVYDAAGRVAATIDANAKHTTQIYDAARRRIALVDANGNRNTFTLDDAGRSPAAGRAGRLRPTDTSFRPIARTAELPRNMRYQRDCTPIR